MRLTPFIRIVQPMNPATEYVTLPVSDGTFMRAYVARPSAAPKAGLIVFQEAFGVNPHIRDLAERFAREGYLAVAPELFHRTAPGLEAGYTDFNAVMPHMQALTDPGLEADIRATWDWLKNSSGFPALSVSAVGYCMGRGRCACHAVQSFSPSRAAHLLYGGGIANSPFFPRLDRQAQGSARRQCCFSGRPRTSAHIGPDQVQAVNNALREAKKPFVNVEFSFADHGFFLRRPAEPGTTPKRPHGNAWALTLTFLARHA